MTNRLVVVSNRVPRPYEPPSPGGLVSALLPSLEETGSALWFGWSGDEVGSPVASADCVTARGITYATVDLTPQQLHAYYEQFGNRVLWPLLHGLAEHASCEAADSYPVYRAVNRAFAAALLPLLRPDDLVWVHDYHLIPFGEELRRLGWRGRIGYFHHTPIPAVDVWSELPYGMELADAFDAYDLIGVQTERDRANLGDILIDDDVAQRVAAYPISIDPDRFRAFTEAAGLAVDGPAIEVPDAPLLYFGVERLDYTKGIPDRLEAFERALEESREMVEGARFVQWAAPSRSTVPEYQAEREAIERAAEHLNARFDATPLEIEFAAHAPELVAPALEQADVCVVSSVADGMNLVAKEFSAVHSAEHPGVLVLSDMCGAAEELTDALLYPAGDVGALSDVLQRAYFMSDGERRQRAAGLRGAVDAHTSSDWLREFVSDLREVQRRTKASETPKARHRQTVTHGDSPPLAPKPQVAG